MSRLRLATLIAVGCLGDRLGAPQAQARVCRSCKTIALGGAPLSVARTVIPALNCKLGKITKKASRKVHKGDVISTSPRPGKTLTTGSKVNVVVSSGPPKRKRKTK